MVYAGILSVIAVFQLPVKDNHWLLLYCLEVIEYFIQNKSMEENDMVRNIIRINLPGKILVK